MSDTETTARLVTSAELAELLGVTRRTIKRYKADGLISPVRQHRFSFLWNPSEVVKALHSSGKCEDIKVPA